MLKRTAIIELSRDRIAVIVPSTTAPSSSCVLLDPEQIELAWNDGLTTLDQPLHKLITDAGVRGGTARLVYASPDAHASLLSLPATTKHAERAARLAMAESCGFPLPEMFAPAVPIVVDRPSESRQCHWLLSFDRAEHLKAGAAWLRRAGVRAEALLPLEATALARAVAEAIHLDASKPAGPAIALRIGRSCAAIAGAHNGRLLFARAISVSVGTMVEALCGPIYPVDHKCDPDTSLQPTRLTREQAMGVAYAGGFSGKDTRLHEASGLTPRDLRPTLQPILQRLVVETRQTLRFGLPPNAEELGAPRLLISGAGVAVNGLVQALGTMLEMHTTAHPGHERFRSDEPISPGSLLEAIRLRDLPRLNLLTGEGAQRLARRRLGTTAAAGLAIAATVGAADFAMTTRAARAIEGSTASYAALVRRADDIASRHEQLSIALQRISAASRTIEHTLSPSLPVAGLLRDIAARMPDGVRLLELSITESSGQPSAHLRVIMPSDPAAEDRPSSAGVAAITRAFEKSPLITRAIVAGITRGSGGDRSGLQIDLTLELVPIPPAPALAIATMEEPG